jgi:bacillopeptidase F
VKPIRRIAGLLTGTLLWSLLAASVHAAVIEPELNLLLQARGAGEAIPVIVTFPRVVDPWSLQETDRRQRRSRLLQALQQEAQGFPAQVQRYAEEHGATQIKSLWAAHALALSGEPSLIRDLAALFGVESIRQDRIMRVFAGSQGHHSIQPGRNGLPSVRKPRHDSDHTGPVEESKPLETVARAADLFSVSAAPTSSPEWNLTAVKGPDLWALGFTGQGVVVASLDTGVDAQHPDLSAQYRGGTNSWFDPHGEHATPADLDGHGTHAMSLAVGRVSGGTAIGMAPDAQWIAAKLFNDAGFARESLMHQSLQWALDPDGDVATDDAPDVVTLSWAVATVNVCNRAFQDELDALRASGIAVVLSAGNSGAGASTSISPANNPGQLSVGSVNQQLTLSPFSSRGPSACDGGMFPAVVAPGEQVRVADRSFGGMLNYATVTGTSFAAPHVAGALALLKSAVPAAPLPVLESALQATAVPLAPQDDSAQPRPWLIDTLAAYRAALIGSGSEGALDREGPMAEGDAIGLRQGVLR